MRRNSVTFDGNGNVIGLVDMATGIKSATYDYNAFGETIQSDGVAAVANHFRFSTKYSDDETGLYYYGFRFYQPTTGRWLSRDTIEEQGGVNLYGFVGNDAINTFDPFGDDFIAVGTRPLKGFLGFFFGGKGAPANHLSIEFYEGCAPEGTKFTSAKIPAGSRRKDARQLLQVDDLYSRYVSRTSVTPSGFTTYTHTEKETVGISFIFSSSTAVDLTVIYSDTDSDGKWAQIVSASDAYPYAEHSSPGGALRNWPNSKYGIPATTNANNSNTFIRVLARAIGRQADVVPGFHPGNDTPVPVSDNGSVPQPN